MFIIVIILCIAVAFLGVVTYFLHLKIKKKMTNEELAALLQDTVAKAKNVIAENQAKGQKMQQLIDELQAAKQTQIGEDTIRHAQELKDLNWNPGNPS